MSAVNQDSKKALHLKRQPMTLKNIVASFSNLGVKERRSLTNDYIELVFYNEEMEKWNKIIMDFFGCALKPGGINPTTEDLRLTKDFGGICKNQVLFKKDIDNHTAIAMFWPWQDAAHTTLKMAVWENNSLVKRMHRWLT